MALDSEVMNHDSDAVMQSVNALVDEYRTRCRFLREDYYPQTPSDACRTLEYIETQESHPRK